MLLEVKKLSKSYGQIRALKEISLRFTPGIYALLGPNGAGKSTLMNILVGNLDADSGSISLDDREIKTDDADYRSVLGFMPQHQKLYESFTVTRFLAYMAALKGMSKSTAEYEISDLLRSLNLEDIAGRRLGACSGGMKQRVLLAQALLSQPKILILDEPTAGLDPAERIRVKNHISAFAADRIVLLATHVVSDVEDIAHELLLIRKGEMLVKGAPGMLLSQMHTKVTELRLSRTDAKDFILRESSRGGSESIRLIRSMKSIGDEMLFRLIESSSVEALGKTVEADLEDLYLSYFQADALDTGYYLSSLERIERK